MGRPKKNSVEIAITPEVRPALERIAVEHGFADAKGYLTALAYTASMGGLGPGARGPGRPPKASPPELPSDVERSTNASGFAGVWRKGSVWQAVYVRGEALGEFATPEHAAHARYWYHRGKISVALASMRDTGSTQESIDSMAKLLGGSPGMVHAQETTLPDDRAFKVGDVVNYDPVFGEGPIRHKVLIVEGPFQRSDDGGCSWRLEGFNELVRQEDIEHAAHDD